MLKTAPELSDRWYAMEALVSQAIADERKAADDALSVTQRTMSLCFVEILVKLEAKILALKD